MKNIHNKPLKICSTTPLTGYNRNGYCQPIYGDYGKHLVCAKMNNKFLNYTAKQGNELRRVVKPGDNWCLCQDRYYQALQANKAPKVITKATSSKLKPHIKNAILKLTKKQNGGKYLPKLRLLSKKNKKHIYKLYDPQRKRILAIEEGINEEKNKTKKNKRDAAKMKKARFNVLRMYRKNKDKKGCKNLTQDMIYMDKKYKLGKTSKICGGMVKTTHSKQFLYNPNDPKKSFDVYIDKNPSDTISIKYSNIDNIKKTIKKLERLYKTKKYPHKRIWQVGMIMKVRMEAMLKHKKTRYKKAKFVRERYNLTKKYFKFSGKRSKAKTFKERKNIKFKI